MINHVAIVRLRPDVTDEQRADLSARVDALVAAQLATTLHFGYDAGIGNRTNADLALVARFPDREGLGAYLVHDRHKEVISLLGAIASDISAVQFVSG